MKTMANALILANVSEKLREFLKDNKHEEKLKTAYKREVEYQRKIYSLDKAFYDANIENDMVILAVSELYLDEDKKTLIASNGYAIGYIGKDKELIKDSDGCNIVMEIDDLGDIMDMTEYDKLQDKINPNNSNDQYKYAVGSFLYASMRAFLAGEPLKDLYTYSDFMIRYKTPKDIANHMEKAIASKTMSDIFAKIVELRDKRNKYSFVFDIFKIPINEWIEVATQKKEKLLSEKYKDYYVTVSITNDGVHNSSLAMGIDTKNKSIEKENTEIRDIVNKYGLDLFQYIMNCKIMDDIFMDFAEIAWKYQDKLNKGSTDIRNDTPNRGKTNYNDKCFSYEGNIAINSNDIEDVYKIITEDEKRKLDAAIELIKSLFDMRKAGVC